MIRMNWQCTIAAMMSGAVTALSICWSPALAADNRMEKRLRIMKKCENCDLSRADLSGINLSRANLNGANLRGANLEGTNLTRATLRGAILDNANLKKAILQYADLRGARLNGADLSGARLLRTRLEKAWLVGANLIGADIDGARFNHADLKGANFRNTNMQKANLDKANLEGANLSGANLARRNFSGMNLSGANLAGANLKNANFQEANLIGANFSNADLQGARLIAARAQNSTFKNVNLTRARLDRIVLNGADLTGANFHKAYMKEASFVGATLTDANLTEANLGRAVLTNAVLKRALFISAYMRNTMLVSADFSGADLSNARMSEVNLGAANLQKSQLSGANLSNSDLRFANLLGAQLEGTSFVGADLRGAKIDGDALKGAKTRKAKLDRELMAALSPPEKPDQNNTPQPAARRHAKPRPSLAATIEKTGIAVQIAEIAKFDANRSGQRNLIINFISNANDGSERLFLGDVGGKIYIVRRGRILPAPFLDIAAARGQYFFRDGESLGLTGFAFHPDFAKPGRPGNGRLYTVHTERRSPAQGSPLPWIFSSPTNKSHHTDILSEWKLDANDPNHINPQSRREIMRIGQPYRDNNLGFIAFNPNAREKSADYGMLYISVGDGGGATGRNHGDSFRGAQDPSTPFGSILRINPIASQGLPYTIPTNNPFMGKTGYLPEIWAYGFRDPAGFSWDISGTGKMIIADRGESNMEELNLGVAGANYGWYSREGTFAVDDYDVTKVVALENNDRGNRFTYPVAQYDHRSGRAIMNGFVYRGNNIPGLRGEYIFGDSNTGRIYYAPVDTLVFGKQAKISELTIFYEGRPRNIIDIVGGGAQTTFRIGLDETGEIFLLNQRDGTIRTFNRFGDSAFTQQ